MMSKWTEAQKAAIDSRNGTILVSAAAGSGKTSVLVRRVIERIIDREHPSSVERLLVVTFTQSAAAEMRERIDKTLTEMIEKDPQNVYLKRQRMLLPSARICTMDSFCSRLVKENFGNIDISPDYTMLSDAEHLMMKRDAVQEVLGELYNGDREGANALLELFTDGKNDENLINSILGIYDFSMAAPYPEQWLTERFKCYFEECPVKESIWGKYALERLEKILSYILSKAEKILLDAPEDGKLGKTAYTDLNSVIASVKEILKMLSENAEWDDIKNAVDSLKLGTFGRFKAEEKDDLYFEIKDRRDTLKSDFERAQKLFVCSSREFNEDMQYLRSVMSAFMDIVLRFTERLGELKKEKSSYHFADILHMTLDLLLQENENGERVCTPLALELQDAYDEIFIDEFQDTNEAQNTLFEAISKNGSNKFMVGDVKQSIYRFRQAMPQIFIEYKERFPDFHGNNYPAKISLDRNFRSRRGVTDAVNFFFELLMTREMGDIDYCDGEQLVFAADYAEHESVDTEVHIVRSMSPRSSNLDGEARYIGKLINDMVSGGMTVGRRGEERPVRYSDICILLRAAKTQAPIVARELSAMGVPAYYKKEGGFFDSTEIVTVLSMLRVIDNPVQDVPLMSVLLSPMFPFTEDDLARMRCNDRHSSIYVLLKNNYNSDEKVKYFLDTVSNLRALSVTLSIGGLIRRIFEITSYDSVVGAMNGGERRALNLQMLIAYADKYEQGGRFGLSGFLRYIDKMRKNNSDLASAGGVSENDDVVQIMTVHKSKGLEFPVVILANCSGKFLSDSDEKALINKSMGAAAVRYDRASRKEFETQPFASLKLKNEQEEMAESLRILYVAMTRAKEKLIMTGSMYEPQKAVRKLYCAHYTGGEDRAVPMSFCQSFMQWIMCAMLYHPALKGFVAENGILNCRAQNDACDIGFTVADAPEPDTVQEEAVVAVEPDTELYTELEKRISYSYPFADLSGIPVKYTASALNSETAEEYLTSSSPEFSSVGSFSPEQRGTFTHRFMELCDLNSDADSLEIEISRLVADGAFTDAEAQCLDRKKISAFFNSRLIKRMNNCEKLLRECEFTMSLPICDIADTASDEQAVVQGVIDGLIINGDSGEIVDYKTDCVKSEDELVNKYRQQMYVYKRAAQECFGLKNVTVTLYSFSMGKEISVD